MNINDAFPSAFVNASQLKGSEHTLTIEGFKIEEMPNGDEAACISFKDRRAGLVLNKTNANAIESLFGPETDEWVGKDILVKVEKVSYQGSLVDGIRVYPTPTATKAPEAAKGDAMFVDDDVPF